MVESVVSAWRRRRDAFVYTGGGAAIGLTKAVALRSDLPQLSVPTTYAGSEVTPILGELAHGVKTTTRDPRVLPKTVIYDVDLTLTLSPKVSATSGVDAMAHAVEALWADNRNPVSDLFAVEAVQALRSALPRITRDPGEITARADALYGSWLAGSCLATRSPARSRLCSPGPGPVIRRSREILSITQKGQCHVHRSDRGNHHRGRSGGLREDQ